MSAISVREKTLTEGAAALGIMPEVLARLTIGTAQNLAGERTLDLEGTRELVIRDLGAIGNLLSIIRDQHRDATVGDVPRGIR